MVDIVKPDISSVWAEAGAVIAPSNEKIKLGWTSEVPPHQYENFVQNRQDEMLAYLNQKGVPEWRTGTEYFLGKSFVQDAGKIYKANKNSGGLLPNQKPSTDATNEYWEQATFSLSDLKQAVGTSTKDVMSQKATSDAIALKVDSTRVKQVIGVSTTDIMSQKAVTDVVSLKVDSSSVKQTTGVSTSDLMSQKAVTEAINGIDLPFKKVFESTELTYTAGAAIGPIAHGLGVYPKFVNFEYRCQVVDAGYAVGDRVFLSVSVSQGASDGLGIAVDATNIVGRWGSTRIGSIINKSTGVVVNLTGTSWKVVIKAYV